MMKKLCVSLVAICFGMDAYCEGVVLSDTAVSGSDYSYTYDTSSGSEQNTRLTLDDVLATDTSDPLYLTPDNHLLSDTFLYYVDEKIRVGQYFDFGVNDSLVVHANILYQWDLSGNKENGFSATEFGGVYRMNHGGDDYHIISDALFGLKVWGSSHVRTPEYADSSYYAGLRFGRRFVGATLSATFKSTWVFDDERGLSYLDFIPEAYFRFKGDWRAGLGFDLRKSTNTHLLKNQEWVNFKLVKQFGRTQYVGHCDYEFETEEIQAGIDIKILF